jgi:hypothetical protein
MTDAEIDGAINEAVFALQAANGVRGAPASNPRPVRRGHGRRRINFNTLRSS